MQKIAKFIIKKFFQFFLVLTGAALFVSFSTQVRSDNDDPKLKYEKILREVGVMLEQGHYSPKKIDDAFSKLVLKKFTEDLDDDRNIFIQSDIEELRKYENRIDDEIHGAELESFFTINDLYLKRLNETSGLFNDILAMPFDYSKDETVELESHKLGFPRSETERKEAWRKWLKYMALSKYVDMRADREKNKDKKDFVAKPDTTLEREARLAVKKQIERFFATKKTHETSDENFNTFVNVITGCMDPHTNYLPPVDKRSFDESMSGSFFGVGAQLKEDDGRVKIASLITGGPAWKSGEFRIDDEIIMIGEGNAEQVDVTGYAVTDAVKLIRGTVKGSVVRLTIRRIDGSVKVVSLVRDEIKQDETYAKSAIINSDHKIGYINLPEFYVDYAKPNGAKCSNDVAREIRKLKNEKVEGIIIDLRGNGGGSLDEVVKMAGLFIQAGPICMVQGREDKPYLCKDNDPGIAYSGPLTVMVDELSASAAEIFTAAIQDYKRGIIIGSSSTYGKGTVQRNIPVNPENDNPLIANKKTEDLGSVKLTIQKFYRINGGATQLKGVTPDIVLPDRFEYLKFREKDNPSALPWDTIAKSNYKPWASTMSNQLVVNYINEELKKNTTFIQLQTDIDWIEKYSNKENSLNIDKYREELKQLSTKYKELDELYKLNPVMKVNNLAADTNAINAAKEKAEKNNQWLKRISNDIYIDESVKVINAMITQSGAAKKN